MTWDWTPVEQNALSKEKISGFERFIGSSNYMDHGIGWLLPSVRKKHNA